MAKFQLLLPWFFVANVSAYEFRSEPWDYHECSLGVGNDVMRTVDGIDLDACGKTPGCEGFLVNYTGLLSPWMTGQTHLLTNIDRTECFRRDDNQTQQDFPSIKFPLVEMNFVMQLHDSMECFTGPGGTAAAAGLVEESNFTEEYNIKGGQFFSQQNCFADPTCVGVAVHGKCTSSGRSPECLIVNNCCLDDLVVDKFATYSSLALEGCNFSEDVSDWVYTFRQNTCTGGEDGADLGACVQKCPLFGPVSAAACWACCAGKFAPAVLV